ncbi:MAG: NADPH-dependent FMN reductase [Acidimicrobiia bacterium]
MSDLTIVVVVGNPSPGGRTSRAAIAVAEKVAESTGVAEISQFELAEVAPLLFNRDSTKVNEYLLALASSDLAIIASPTYKASFTGLLKAFLDRYGSDGLAGVVAVPVMLGASPIHHLAPETQLRPVLIELGATMPTRSFFLVDRDIDRVDEKIATWWANAENPLLRSLGLG